MTEREVNEAGFGANQRNTLKVKLLLLAKYLGVEITK
jgi:hypothetical protein